MASRRNPVERAQRLKQLERQQKLRQGARWAAYSVVGILVIAGAAYGISLLPEKPGMVHYHAKYQVYVDGEQVSFDHPAFNGMKYGPAHLHAPEYDKLHNEGREGSGTLGKFFAYTLEGKLSDNEMILPQGTSHPGTYVVNETKDLRLFVDNPSQDREWAEVQSDFADVSFQDGDRYLLLYGNYTDEEVLTLQQRYPSFDPTSTAG